MVRGKFNKGNILLLLWKELIWQQIVALRVLSIYSQRYCSIVVCWSCLVDGV